MIANGTDEVTAEVPYRRYLWVSAMLQVIIFYDNL